MATSKKYSLNKADFIKIVKGAGIALIGAFGVYLTTISTQINFGEMTPIVVAGISVLANVILKFTKNNQ